MKNMNILLSIFCLSLVSNAQCEEKKHPQHLADDHGEHHDHGDGDHDGHHDGDEHHDGDRHHDDEHRDDDKHWYD